MKLSSNLKSFKYLRTDFRCAESGFVFRISWSWIGQESLWQSDWYIIGVEYGREFIAHDQFIRPENGNGRHLKEIAAPALRVTQRDQAWLMVCVNKSGFGECRTEVESNDRLAIYQEWTKGFGTFHRIGHIRALIQVCRDD